MTVARLHTTYTPSVLSRFLRSFNVGMMTMTQSITATSDTSSNSDQSSPNHDHDRVDELPLPLQRAATASTPLNAQTKRSRHSKKLSLNFPILVPPPQEQLRIVNGSASGWSPSPTVSSPYHANTPSSGIPFPSPDELRNGHSISDGPDFLTLIAGQERKVMELKEELSKAESALLGLKKQWAVYEAKKKQQELRSKTVRLGPVSPQTTTNTAEDEELERVKRRELREQKMKELGMTEGELGRADSKSGRRNGGRVFAGRHTRTLSLLQNNPPDPSSAANRPTPRTEGSLSSIQQGDSPVSTPTSTDNLDQEEKRQHRRSLSRQATLQELIANSATGAAQINFGKTYKELATASRKSLPPGADVFVKQGKQVYDGVSQGFWNFVEDIRQATVGDEAVNGIPIEPRNEVKKMRSNKKLKENGTCDKHGRDHKQERTGDNHKPEKDNFWKEFGIETPKNQKQKEGSKTHKTSGSKKKDNTTSSKDHESKSSTDSKCPPSLLGDLTDGNEDDEAWDNWPTESPMSQRQRERAVNIRRDSDDTDEEPTSRASPISHKSPPKNRNRKPSEAWMGKPSEAWTDLMT